MWLPVMVNVSCSGDDTLTTPVQSNPNSRLGPADGSGLLVDEVDASS
jgi:hypothetical protein